MRHQVTSVSTHLISAAFGFAAFGLLARSLGGPEFGAWILVITVMTTADLVRSGLVQTAVVRFMAREAAPEPGRSAAPDTQRDEAVGSAWLVSACVTVLPAALFVVTESLGLWLPFDGWSVVAAATLATTLPIQWSSWLAQAEERFRVVLVLRVAPTALFAAIILLTRPRDPFEVGLYYASAQAPTALFALAAGWARSRSVTKATRLGVGRVLSFGRHTLTTTVSAGLLRSSKPLLIGLLAGPAAVAAFAIPQKLVEIVEIPLRGVSAALLPELSRIDPIAHPGRRRAVLLRWIIGLTVLCAVGAGLLGLFATQLLARFAGDGYGDSAPLLRIFALALVVLPADRLTGIALDAAGAPEKNARKVLVLLAVSVTADALSLAAGLPVVACAVVYVFVTALGAGLGWFQAAPSIAPAPRHKLSHAPA